MKKNYSQEIFLISTLTLTVTFMWVYLSVYRALRKSEEPVLSPKEVRVLSPKLDGDVFEELSRRKK